MLKLLTLTAAILTAAALTGCNPSANRTNSHVPDNTTEQTIMKTVTINSNDLVADSAGDAKLNASIINKAVKDAEENTKIIIPDGTYYIDGRIKISGKKNITLCGSEETVLVNSSYIPLKPSDKAPVTYNRSNIFAVSGSTNISVCDLTLDYLNHGTLDGVITSVENGKTKFQPYEEFTDGEMTAVTDGVSCFSALIANENGFYNEAWLENGKVITKEADGSFSIPVQIGNNGDRICCRISSGTYSSPLFYINETAGLNLSGITCYSCPSAFIYAPYGNSDFTFSNLKVIPKDGSEKLLASNEDIIHIKQLRGKLTLKDCTFKGLGDDALNIHSKLARITCVNSNGADVEIADNGEKLPSTFFEEGDSVEFFDTSGNVLGNATVISFKKGTLEVDSFPQNVTEGCLIQNISCVPDTVVENCSISFGRARGVLLQTVKASVKNCSFRDLRLSGILISPDFDKWLEAGYCDSIEIHSNEFNNCASLNNGFGVIHISACHDNPSHTASGDYHGYIEIKDCIFNGCKGESIKATGIKELK